MKPSIASNIRLRPVVSYVLATEVAQMLNVNILTIICSAHKYHGWAICFIHLAMQVTMILCIFAAATCKIELMIPVTL